MPIRSLQDLRQQAQAAGWSGSDESIIKQYADHVGVDPFSVATQLGYDPGKGSLTNERLSSAFDNYQSGLYETAGLGARALGLQGASDWLQGKAADNRFQADVAAQRAKLLGGVDSYTEVDGVGSALNYAGGLAAQSLPYAAEMLAGGVGARLLARKAIASRMGQAQEAIKTAEAIGDVQGVKAGLQALKEAEKLASNVGMAGGVAASYPSAVGDILGNQVDQSGETNDAYAAAGGAAYAGLNALGLGRVLGAGKINPLRTAALDARVGVTGGLARMGASAGTTAFGEGIGELGQEVINQGGRMSVDPEVSLLDRDAMGRYAESFVGGAVMGGVTGGLGNFGRRSEQFQDSQLEQNLLTRTEDVLRKGDPNPMGPVQIYGPEERPLLDSYGPGDGPTYQPPVQEQGTAPVTPGDLYWNDGRDERFQQDLFFPNGEPTYAADQGYFSPRQYALATQPQPLQQTLNDQLGIDAQPYAGKGYGKQFSAAASEPTGIVGQDVNTGFERPMDMGQFFSLQAGSADTAAPEPTATPAVVTSPVDHVQVKAADLLKERGGLSAKAGKAVELARQFVEAGLDLRGDLDDSSFWAALTTYKYPQAEKRLAELKAEASASELLSSLPKALADRQITTGRGATAKTVTGYELFKRILTAPQKDKERIYMALGLDEDTDPTTGKKTIVAGYAPLTYEAIGQAQGVGATAIENMLNGYGITKEVVARFVAPEPTDTVSESELAAGNDEEALPGFRVEDSLSKAAGAGLVDNGATETLQQRQARVQAEAILKTAPKEAKASRRVFTPEQEARITEQNRAKVEANIAALLADPEADNAAADWEGQTAWEDLPDSLKADFIDDYRRELKNGNGSIDRAGFQRLARIQGELDDIARAGQQAQAGAGSPNNTAADVGLEVQDGNPVRKTLRRTATGGQRGTGATASAASSGEQLWGSFRETVPGLNPYSELSVNEKGYLDEVADATKGKPTLSKHPSLAELISNHSPGGALHNEEALNDIQATSSGLGSTSSPDIRTAGKAVRADSPENTRGKRSVQAERSGTEPAVRKYSASELTEEITAFVRAGSVGRNVVIVESAKDLPSSVARLVGATTQGVAVTSTGGGTTAYLVADQITVGSGRAVFLHEVGVHIGLERLLSPQQFARLAEEIRKAADSGSKDQFSTLARAASKRVEAAHTESADVDSELVAYFVEEAVQSGVNPTAEKVGPFYKWFRTLWAAFKVALHRFGVNPDKMTAQDVVDMAYGAARLEVAGAFHGTAAQFRRFDHKYMGSGEGAQAFGWGTYLAQRYGIAHGYWKDDVARKARRAERERELRWGDGSKVSAADVETLSLMLDFDSDRGLRLFSVFGNSLDNDWRSNARTLLADRRNIIEAEKRRVAAVKAAEDAYSSAEKAYKDRAITFDDLMAARDKEYQDKKAAGYKPFMYDRTVSEAKLLEKVLASGLQISRADPDGSLMRVDVAVPDSEMLDWDKPLSSQDFIASQLSMYLPNSLREAVEEEANLSLGEMTGEDFYRALQFLESRDGLISEQFDVADYNKRLSNAPANQIVSTYLDEQIGIKAIKFLDSRSRGPTIDLAPLIADVKAAKESLERIKSGAPNDAEIEYEISLEDAEELVAVRERALARARENNDYPRAHNIVVFNDKNLFRVASNVGASRSAVKFSKAATPSTDTVASGLSKALRYAKMAASDVADLAKLRVAFTDDLVSMASKYLPSAQLYQKETASIQTEKTRLERDIAAVLEKADTLPRHLLGTGPSSINTLIADMRVEGEWAFDPVWVKNRAKLKFSDKLKARFDAMPTAAQEVVKAVFKQNHDNRAKLIDAVMNNIASEYDLMAANAPDDAAKEKAKADKAKALTKFQTVFSGNEAEPYAPLRRYGNYIVMGASAQYKAELDAVRQGTGDVQLLEQMKGDPQHYFLAFAETKMQARAVHDGLKDKYAHAQFFEKLEDSASWNTGADMIQMFNRVRSALNSKTDGAAQTELDQLMQQVYLTMLSETSARKAELNARKVAGFDGDMLRAFASHGRAMAHFIASVKSNGKAADYLLDMRKEAARSNDRTEAQAYFNEIVRRHTSHQAYTPNAAVEKIMGATSVYMLLTNVSYYVVNALQPMTMSLPVLAGRFGAAKAVSSMTSAYSDVASLLKDGRLTEDDYLKLPKDVRLMVQELVDAGRIDIMMDMELGRWDSGQGAASRTVNSAMRRLRSVAQMVEAANRLVTAIAAYRMATEGGASHAAARDLASRVVYETQGDYSQRNAPRFMRSGIGRLLTQFRKFQLIQLSFMARMVSQAFKGASRDERFLGRKMLAYTLGMQFAMGGLVGLPAFTLVSFLAGLALPGDEPDDPEATLRRLIDNKPMADLLLKGLPKGLGLDVSQRLGAGGMLSVLPYTDIDVSRSGYEKMLLGLLGPAIGGMGSRLADGADQLSSGDPWKGLELLMPSGVTNLMKAARFSSDGLTTRNGDVVLSASEMNWMHVAMQAVGFAPNPVQDRSFMANAGYKAETYYKERVSELKLDYTRAYRSGDEAGRKEALENWATMQEYQRKLGIKPSPMSELLKAPMEQRKREAAVVNGVKVRKGNEQLILQLAQ